MQMELGAGGVESQGPFSILAPPWLHSCHGDWLSLATALKQLSAWECVGNEMVLSSAWSPVPSPVLHRAWVQDLLPGVVRLLFRGSCVPSSSSATSSLSPARWPSGEQEGRFQQAA